MPVSRLGDSNTIYVCPAGKGTRGRSEELSGFVAASFFFGYMRIYTGSIWPASIAHAVHNAAWNVLGAVTLITASPVLVDVYLVGDFGLLILIGTAIGAIWVGRRLKRGMDEAQSGAEAPRVAPAPPSVPTAPTG